MIRADEHDKPKALGVIFDEFGRRHVCGELIGSGGQGEVYRSREDGARVIKIFSGMEKTDAKEDRARYVAKVHALMALDILYGVKRVAMPDAALNAPYCGYTMPLMQGLEGIGRQSPGQQEMYCPYADSNDSLLKKFKVLSMLAGILRDMHRKGIIYCDLSSSNVFVSKHPADHEVWLIDPDNICFANRCRRCTGTGDFTAPEVAGRQTVNSPYSDVYSFAVVAFRYLTGEFPIIVTSAGGGWDDDGSPDDDDSFGAGAGEYMYESEGSPAGVPLDLVATEKIKKLFMMTFGKKGREVPSSRPTAEMWRKAFDEAADSLNFCVLETELKDEESAGRAVLSRRGCYFIGDECKWAAITGARRLLPEMYVLEIVPPQVQETGDWEDTDPALPTDFAMLRKELHISVGPYGCGGEKTDVKAEYAVHGGRSDKKSGDEGYLDLAVRFLKKEVLLKFVYSSDVGFRRNKSEDDAKIRLSDLTVGGDGVSFDLVCRKRGIGKLSLRRKW